MFNLSDPSLLKTHSFINGSWTECASGRSADVINPASGTAIASVSDAGTTEAKLAIRAAEAALNGWRQKTASERSFILMRWHGLILENLEDLAQILTFEQGKPFLEARAEIQYGASFVQWFAEEAKRVYGDIIPHTKNGQRFLTLKEPIGVVAAITPWNFPNAMITRKVAPALAAGCTMVLKPAIETPLSAFALAELAQRSGIPPGVLNIVAGKDAPSIGKEFTKSPLVRKLTFTGSTAVGKLLMQQCAGTVKRTSMELGGNAPFIIFSDADLDQAVEGVMASKFRNAGQTCVCADRILVQSNIMEKFTEKLKAAVKSLRIGGGMQEGVSIGPLISSTAAEKANQIVHDAVQKGAEIITGGKIAANGNHFYEPTILKHVTPNMLAFTDELFSPIAPLTGFDGEEEAIELANDTPYGLASYVYTRDVGRCWRIAEALEFGMVGVNEGIISTEAAPFGGMKQSGNGREGSKYGIEDYLEVKYVCMGGLAH